MKIYQLDVKTAYLNAPLDYEVFIEQPPGFEEKDKNGVKLVMKLKKSLYGLRQSGRMWNQLLHDFLISNKFVQSKSDHCVYILHERDDRIILIVWVDDIIIAARDPKEAEAVKQKLAKKFRMKDFGMISSFLGIEFEISKHQIFLHQTN